MRTTNPKGRPERNALAQNRLNISRIRTILVILLYREGYTVRDISELMQMSNRDIMMITREVERDVLGELQQADIDIPVQIMKKRKIPRI